MVEGLSSRLLHLLISTLIHEDDAFLVTSDKLLADQYGIAAETEIGRLREEAIADERILAQATSFDEETRKAINKAALAGVSVESSLRMSYTSALILQKRNAKLKTLKEAIIAEHQQVFDSYFALEDEMKKN